MQRIPDPDILPFHSQHGFDWHFVARTIPGLETYPTDLAEAFCGDLLERDEYVEAVEKDMCNECRHGLGHAVYYVLAAREMNQQILYVSFCGLVQISL